MKNRLFCLVMSASVVAATATGCFKKNRDDGPQNPPTEQVPESVAPLLQTFAGAGQTVTEVAAPLSESGVAEDDMDTTAKSDVQEGLGGERTDGDNPAAITDPTCISFTWDRLTATVTYDQCVSQQTSEIIDGELTIRMTIIPVTFSVTATNLTIGARLFNGTVSLSFRGTAPNRTIQLAFDLTIDDGSQNQIDLDGATLTVGEGIVTVDGSGTFSNSTLSATFTATDVTWTGDCLPASGTVDFDDGTFFGTAEFLPTTPDTGDVRVVIPPFIDSIEPIFAPGC